MKPSTRHVLNQLHQGPQTTHDLLMAGCGSRFGARICELRNEFGYVIDEARLPLPTRGSRYTLVSGPEVGQASSEAKGPLTNEQASPGSVPSSEGVRLAAPAEPPLGLFDVGAYDRERWKDVA